MNETTLTSEAGARSAVETGFADRVRSAVFWRWGSQVLSQLITWSVTIAIVRLLEPRDFGLFAMTQAVLTAFNFLSGWGFANTLITSRTINERRIGQVFGMLLLSNAVLAAAQFAAAPLAASYYNQPLVADMLRLQAVIFLTTPFIALPTALLSRKLDFRSQARINLASSIAGAAVGITLALLDFGVWTLVWSPIAIFGVRAIGLTLAARMLVKPILDFRGAGDIVRFGSALMVSQLFWIIQSQADIVIAGRMFTTHDLGLYSEALFVALIFTGRFLPPLNEVAFPAYAELAKAGRPIAPAFLAGVRMIMLATAPLYIGLSLVAGPLVETMFGAKWLGMISILSGLALAMPAMALQICCSPATNALGSARSYLLTNLAGAVIMPACFLIGVQYGPSGLVAAWQISAPLLLLATLAVALPRIDARWVDLARSLVPVILCCTIMAAAVVLLRGQITDLNAPLRLVLLSLTGAAVYFAALTLGWPDLLRQGREMIGRRSPTGN